jgi:hypothetical protein
MAIESDTGKFKFGDNNKKFSELNYVGIAPIGDDKTIEVSVEGAIALLGSTTATAGTLPMLEEVEVEGKKVNKLVWKTLEDIGSGDGNDNTTYEFEFDEEKIFITIKENGVAKSDKVELDLSGFVTTDELAEELSKLVDNDTKYHLEYDSNNKQIKLVTGESEDMTIDAAPFIRDGMIEKVELVDYQSEGDEKEEKHLKITWNIDDANVTDDNSDKDVVYVPVKDLVDVYTAGNGLDLNGSAFSIKIDASSEAFLTVGSDGLKLSGINQAISDLFDDDSQHKASNSAYGVIMGEEKGANITEGKIASISTDILANGEIEFVLCAGDANGFV